MPEVYKLGGASIRDADAIRHLGELLTRQVPPPRALVISAMGKTTNALEALVGDLPVVTEKTTASTAQWLLPADACPERWRLP